MTVTINGTSGLVFNDASTQATAATGFGFKNRIINGAMMIDQRNAGASVSLTSGGFVYSSDRFYVENATDGTATIQQVTDAPTGFSNSIKYTVTGTDSSIASTQSAFVQQRIEGFNTADLMYGTANAQTVTVSFWVKSSITGTFGGALANSAYNRAYSFSYTINSANTWEYKTVTIAGDTTGTWIGATNGTGLRVSFAVTAGSDRSSTAGAWGSFVGIGVASQVNLMATNGATFYITGVMLEKGSTATNYDVRPYGTELALCQRYYELYTISNGNMMAVANSSTRIVGSILAFRVTKRTSPTVTGNDLSKVTTPGITDYFGVWSFNTFGTPGADSCIPIYNYVSGAQPSAGMALGCTGGNIFISAEL
jgi:hypothetical protein